MEQFHFTPSQQRIVSELLTIATAEEKLEFLIDRTPLLPPLSKEEIAASDKVPGCPSGLWLLGKASDEGCVFRAHSDSTVVAGVAGILCDLYSARSAQEIVSLPDAFVRQLGIEQLLSMNRRQAVRHIVEFVRSFATGVLCPVR